MELGTISILVQLLLIFALVAVFTGLRRMRIRREQRDTTPGAAPGLSAHTAAPAAPPAPAPVLTELPVAGRRAPHPQGVSSHVSEELLPACFADTCADWAQVASAPARAPDTRFSLADWSAPTDHVALDTSVDPATLDWALDARVEPPRVPRPVADPGGRRSDVLHNRAAGAPMHLT
ncbi:hypothetical protein [Sphaerotilus sp.]|uniref:hypothetical protein n=1 Tax=Sphaerotilus sp. TaxID=2093942 RepID=UPI002ACD4072|nr:hypothetical protein [Sphaerotilus sp.]MDZ7858550.1 hypothetical protein [Sphaerotilus sp.]